jgi:hypothetical protein
VPHWHEVEAYDPRYKTHKLYSSTSKVFGSFEDEYSKYTYDKSYFLQKKMYFCSGTQIDKKTKEVVPCSTFHFKGISDNDIFIKDHEDDHDGFIRDLECVKAMTQKEKFEHYNTTEKIRIKDDYIGFFEQLHTQKHADVLTFSMQRVSGNQKKNTTPDQRERQNDSCYTVKSRYAVKSLRVTDQGCI